MHVWAEICYVREIPNFLFEFKGDGMSLRLFLVDVSGCSETSDVVHDEVIDWPMVVSTCFC